MTALSSMASEAAGSENNFIKQCKKEYQSGEAHRGDLMWQSTRRVAKISVTGTRKKSREPVFFLSVYF